jgi:hypothetical protein
MFPKSAALTPLCISVNDDAEVTRGRRSTRGDKKTTSSPGVTSIGLLKHLREEKRGKERKREEKRVALKYIPDMPQY